MNGKVLSRNGRRRAARRDVFGCVEGAHRIMFVRWTCMVAFGVVIVIRVGPSMSEDVIVSLFQLFSVRVTLDPVHSALHAKLALNPPST